MTLDDLKVLYGQILFYFVGISPDFAILGGTNG